MSSAQALLPLLPQASAAGARLHDAAARALLRAPAWRPRLVLDGRAPSAAPAPVLQVRTRLGSLQLRIDHGFDALVNCQRLEDPAQREGVASLLLTHWAANWLPALGACDAQFVAHGMQDKHDPSLPGLCCEHGGATVLQADAAVLRAVHSALDAMPLPFTAVLQRCGGLRLTGRLVMAHQPMAHAALRRLRVGDVVLTRRPCAGRRPRLAGTGSLDWTWLHTRHTPWARCTPEERTMTLDTDFDFGFQDEPDAPPVVTETPAPDDAPTHGSVSAAQDLTIAGEARPTMRLDDLQLPVVISLPAPTMTLAELCALAPGAVLTLPAPLEDATVQLSLQGQPLAHGELVAIGGRLGVRIVRLGAALNMTGRGDLP